MSKNIEQVETFEELEQKGLEERGLSSSYTLKKIRSGELFGYEFKNINNDSRRVLWDQAFEKKTHLLQEKHKQLAPVIFGPIDSSKVVWCTEGETDAIPLSNHTENVISFPGAVATKLSDLKEQLFMNLSGSETFAIVFDNDEAGRGGSKRLREELLNVFPNSVVKVIDISLLDSKVKDIREGLSIKRSFNFENLLNLVKQSPTTDQQTLLLDTIVDSETDKLKLPIAYDEKSQELIFSIMNSDSEKSRVLISSDRNGSRKVSRMDESLLRNFEIEEEKDIPYVKGFSADLLKSKWREKIDPTPLYKSIKSYIHSQIFFSDFACYDLHTLGIMLTYLFTVFKNIPYMHIKGNKHCGKSQLSHIYQLLAFNADESTSSTMAAMRRVIHHNRGTLILDDWETARSSNQELISLLNAGYFTQAKSMIVNNDKTETMRLFTGGPKVFNSISNIDPVLASRCITTPMIQAPIDFKRKPQLAQEAAKALKTDLLLWALDYHGKVTEISKAMGQCISREEELYHPLLAIAQATCGEGQEVVNILKLKNLHSKRQAENMSLNDIVLDEVHELWSETKPAHEFKVSIDSLYRSLNERDDLPASFRKNSIKDALASQHILIGSKRERINDYSKPVVYTINVPAMLSTWRGMKKHDVLPNS